MITFALISSSVAVYGTGRIVTDWSHYAHGTIDGYEDPDTDMPAEIVSGVWNLNALGKKVWFYACYFEKNLHEETGRSPENSIDIHEWSFIGKPFWMHNDDTEETLTLLAQIQIKKAWAKNDKASEPETYTTWAAITIDFSAETIHIDTWPLQDDEPLPPHHGFHDWDKMGTVIDNDYF